MNPKTPAGRAGFTLIELLTVIAIIGILAAIIIPTVSAVKTRAAQAKALSNLRQIGSAFSLYANDNKGFLPKVGSNRKNSSVVGNDFSWDSVLLLYFNFPFTHSSTPGFSDLPKEGGFVHPSAESVFFHPRDHREKGDGSRARRTWSMNRNFSSHIRLEKLSRTPSQIVLVSERLEGNLGFAASGSFADLRYFQQVEADGVTVRSGYDFNGNGKLDYLFADGHVKAMKPVETLNGATSDATGDSFWIVR